VCSPSGASFQPGVHDLAATCILGEIYKCAHTRVEAARRCEISVLEAFAPPYRSQLSDGRRRAGVGGQSGLVLSLRTERLFTLDSTRSGRLLGGRGDPASGLSLRPCAGLNLQAFALSRSCAAGSPVTPASGRLPSLTGQSVCRRCYGVRCLLRPGVSSNHAGHVGLSPLPCEIPCAAHSWSRRSWDRVFLRPGMQASELSLGLCAGLERSHRVPLGRRVVPGVGADLGDQRCGRRYGVRCFLSRPGDGLSLRIKCMGRDGQRELNHRSYEMFR
jgi:hypothetical protein